MSDISDVLVVLAQKVACIVYPTLTWDQITQNWDTGQLWDLAKGKSIIGTDVRIYPGWPTSNELDADLSNGISHITVFPTAQERNTTRYLLKDYVTAGPCPTLTLAISGPSLTANSPLWDLPGVTWDGGNFDQPVLVENFIVTVGGKVAAPQNLALRINGEFYVYAVQASDTFASIAAALGALVQASIPDTTVNGASITIGPSGRLQAARIGGFGTVAKEVRRQERVVQIIVWANAPDVRDCLAGAVDVVLADTQFLCMPDGFGARVIYKNSMVIDALQKADLYRRDLNYTVEYATTVSKQRAQVIAPFANVNENQIVVTA